MSMVMTRPRPVTSHSHTQSTPKLITTYTRYEDIIDTDEEGEFFDTIEANTFPDLLVSKFLTSPIDAEPALSFMCTEHLLGYQQLRVRVLIGSDDRPSTSFSSVLKHSIGKDLPKARRSNTSDSTRSVATYSNK